MGLKKFFGQKIFFRFFLKGKNHKENSDFNAEKAVFCCFDRQNSFLRIFRWQNRSFQPFLAPYVGFQEFSDKKIFFDFSNPKFPNVFLGFYAEIGDLGFFEKFSKKSENCKIDF